jgi:ABC-type polysaccharide/polyol phosphate transport system ATPase subunit
MSPSVHLENLSLTFSLRDRGRRSFKDTLLGPLLGTTRPVLRQVEALRGINLEAKPGERIGLIGHNGAGKSTLLRMIAGVYAPTSGTRIVNGRISSLLDLGLGIELDATGWENMEYRGYLQKQSPREIRSKMQEIAEFSELGTFLDMPVRYYSSGMLVRLTFAIATAVEPEILILDEVFSAGDLSFQEKAKTRMLGLVHRAQILVLASHDMQVLRQVCDRVLWLDHGSIRDMGPPDRVITAYHAAMSRPPQAAAA